jgi:hypothetical protein
VEASEQSLSLENQRQHHRNTGARVCLRHAAASAAFLLARFAFHTYLAACDLGGAVTARGPRTGWRAARW